jgi:glutathione S-transferase
MKLYFSPGACSLAADIALFEAGVKFERAQVDLRTHKVGGADFYAINPKGYVPTLGLDDGQILTENVAVLQYIADRNPAAKLAPPAGTPERYRLQEWLAFINSEVHKSYAPLFSAESSDDAKEGARRHLAKRFAYLNGVLESRKFLMGDQFTVADAYLFVVLRWSAHVGVDLKPWPTLGRLIETVGARPHVIEALTAEGLIKA